MSLTIVDIIFIFLFVVGLITIVFFVIPQTIRGSGKYGINLKGRCCPNCGKRLPFPSLPKSIVQLWENNRNCPYCGCEMDIWGKKV